MRLDIVIGSFAFAVLTHGICAVENKKQNHFRLVVFDGPVQWPLVKTHEAKT